MDSSNATHDIAAMIDATHSSGSSFQFASTDEAAAALCAELRPVDIDTIDLAGAWSRVLADPITADRDSPPCDVSQMDGYAVRHADTGQRTLAIAGEAAMGQAPVELPPGKAVRIFTGAPIPAGAEAVIPREDVDERPDEITLEQSRAVTPGQFIRRQGENLRAGEQVHPGGGPITSAVMSALATFGVSRPRVFRRVRVAIVVTGNELLPVDATPSPWQIRDSNGPALVAMLSNCPWLRVEASVHAVDEPDRVRAALAERLERSDVVLLTGGVSMGRYDYVPQVIASLGGRIVFHKLPIRPGKPVLGAIGPDGQAVLGLPGNPVSVMVTARRIGAAILRRLAGFQHVRERVPMLNLTNPDDKILKLTWFRAVRLTAPGQGELVPTRGSGDVVSAARSDGFVEIPPSAIGPGPWPFYRWEL